MKVNIPGKQEIEIENIVFDYNGTIAIDGKLIDGVKENINKLSNDFNFFVITADTYGSVEQELKSVNCKIIKIEKSSQDISKEKFIKELGSNTALCVGNGRNDKLMLKEAILGIAILQDEGICTQTLLNSDILVKSILDVFGFLNDKNRLIATLRN
ncbi:soluble P-type ATPase [Malaciobacter marinus]|jgi:soluble P-type ATPase|uniref:Soluble P-type ATPase n=1 Tax=Malaciobacter marinus TaxID=505249 RepID=A0AB37A0E4_9BACT|nr:HAD family hydrolase [Malaciobacter marinus]PPK63050.1 soluble P-type ATPase [Malaciobacter marinus]SKB75415.1 Soluble P-type ATPase [Malaciobacter marinus]